MDKDPSIITLMGDNPGKILTVMAGVHGNEICGIEALRQVINSMQISCGKVNFIFANLVAIALNVRYTQMNLNRAFRPDHLLGAIEQDSYERRRALELMPFLDESDALLDLHSSRNKGLPPFIIYEPHSEFIAKKFPFQIRTHGWNALFPGGADYYINRRGGNGICIECGFHSDTESIERALRSINIFLGLFGAITLDEPIIEKTSQREISVDYVYFTKINFRLARTFSDFETIQQGELVGHDGNEAIFAHRNGVIIFPHNIENPNEEAFVLGQEVVT